MPVPPKQPHPLGTMRQSFRGSQSLPSLKPSQPNTKNLSPQSYLVRMSLRQNGTENPVLPSALPMRMHQTFAPADSGRGDASSTPGGRLGPSAPARGILALRSDSWRNGIDSFGKTIDPYRLPWGMGYDTTDSAKVPFERTGERSMRQTQSLPAFKARETLSEIFSDTGRAKKTFCPTSLLPPLHDSVSAQVVVRKESMRKHFNTLKAREVDSQFQKAMMERQKSEWRELEQRANDNVLKQRGDHFFNEVPFNWGASLHSDFILEDLHWGATAISPPPSPGSKPRESTVEVQVVVGSPSPLFSSMASRSTTFTGGNTPGSPLSPSSPKARDSRKSRATRKTVRQPSAAAAESKNNYVSPKPKKESKDPLFFTVIEEDLVRKVMDLFNRAGKGRDLPPDRIPRSTFIRFLLGCGIVDRYVMGIEPKLDLAWAAKHFDSFSFERGARGVTEAAPNTVRDEDIARLVAIVLKHRFHGEKKRFFEDFLPMGIRRAQQDLSFITSVAEAKKKADLEAREKEREKERRGSKIPVAEGAEEANTGEGGVLTQNPEEQNVDSSVAKDDSSVDPSAKDAAQRRSSKDLSAAPGDTATIAQRRLSRDLQLPPDIEQGPTKAEDEAAEDGEEEPPDVDQSEVDRLTSEFRVRNQLCEPEAMQTAIGLQPLFTSFFTEYHDYPARSGLGQEGEGHMSFCAFLRFLVDFQLFPKCISYTGAQRLYNTALCVRIVVPTKTSRAYASGRLRADAGRNALPTQGLLPDGLLKKIQGIRKTIAPKVEQRRASQRISLLPDASSAMPSDMSGTGSRKSSLIGSRRPSHADSGSGSRRQSKDRRQSNSSEDRSGSKDSTGSARGSRSRSSSKDITIDKPKAAPKLTGQLHLDFLKKDQADMSQLECQAYAVMSSLEQWLTNHMARARELFKQVDEDGNEVISVKEFTECLDQVGLRPLPSKEEVRQIFNMMDANQDGELSLWEFDKAMLEMGKARTANLKSQDVILPSHALQAQLFLKLEDMDFEPKKTGSKDGAVVVFGSVAFGECLLKLTLMYLNDYGNGVQGSAPVHAKIMWLSTFLKGCLLSYYEQAKKDGATCLKDLDAIELPDEGTHTVGLRSSTAFALKAFTKPRSTQKYWPPLQKLLRLHHQGRGPGYEELKPPENEGVSALEVLEQSPWWLVLKPEELNVEEDESPSVSPSNSPSSRTPAHVQRSSLLLARGSSTFRPSIIAPPGLLIRSGPSELG